MLYFEEPDTHAHIFGLDSNIVDNLIQKLDNITFYLEVSSPLSLYNFMYETILATTGKKSSIR